MARVGYLDPGIDVGQSKFIRIIFEGEAAFYFLIIVTSNLTRYHFFLREGMEKMFL